MVGPLFTLGAPDAPAQRVHYRRVDYVRSPRVIQALKIMIYPPPGAVHSCRAG
jgi:hypothetical protein